jgi:hypothetical protein
MSDCSGQDDGERLPSTWPPIALGRGRRPLCPEPMKHDMKVSPPPFWLDRKHDARTEFDPEEPPALVLAVRPSLQRRNAAETWPTLCRKIEWCR